MRAVAKLAARDGAMAVIDRPEPARGADEVLVRISAGGICGTDVAIWRWHEAVVGQYAPSFPVIVGHEFSGRVIDAPADSGLVAGQVVGINPQIGCGRCRYCGLGRPTLCDNRRLMGGHIDGGWTEVVAVRRSQVFALPPGVDPAVAPLLEPLAVAVHAVFGAGPIGLLTGLLARHGGASQVVITGVAADASRLALAARLGMTGIQVEHTDPVSVLGKTGADVVYETSGNAAVVSQVLAMAGKAGRVGLIGLCHGPSTVITTPTVLKELELIGSRGYNDPTWRLVMRLLPAIAPSLLQLVTHRFRFEDFEAALETVAAREGVKVLLEP